ncbi:hypothetical protein MSIMFB_03105 [Mycobacterium simulans]|uniref:Methyltransferase domain-containing protein n=1 Tax=Mycobacterium simulans TaxID=627089 RepID=A0A7Z7INN5_9MYCO|nr:hypothetical protein MSIMFB_03105 [Mycobacterium simulans]
MGWAVTRRLPTQRPLRIAELGSGAGRFTSMLVTIGQGPVYAIEPSEQMRRVAVAKHLQPEVHHIAGRAESIPLTPSSTQPLVHANRSSAKSG